MMSHRNMFHFLNSFGKSEEMLLGAEGFLIACIDKSPKKAKTFDELRVSVFSVFTFLIWRKCLAHQQLSGNI